MTARRPLNMLPSVAMFNHVIFLMRGPVCGWPSKLIVKIGPHRK